MTSYTVQFVLPVDNPEKNVRMTKRKNCIHFEVPLNYPSAEGVTLSELYAAAERSGLLGLPTHLNNKKTLRLDNITKPERIVEQ